MIKRVTADATEESMKIFTWEFINHFTKLKMMEYRIFNRDETGFAHKNRIRKVIYVTGSKNICSKSVEASFHMTIVACVAANVLYVPPLFILSSQQFNRATMDQCSVTGSTAKVAPK